MYLSNLTRDELVIVGRGVEVHLPPLATRYPVSQEVWRALDLERLVMCPDVEVATFQDAKSEDAVQRWLGLGAIVSIVTAMVAWLGWGGILAGLAVYAGLMVVSAGLVYLIGTGPASNGARAGWSARSRPSLSQLLGGVADTLVPTFVLVVGFVAALLVSWHVVTGKPMSLLVTTPGEIAKVFSDRDMTGGQNAVELALRTLFLGLAITFPAAMYFTFERQRGDALRTRFVLDMFRLDDRLGDVGALRARYGSRMRDVFGDEGDSPGAPISRHGLRYNAPLLISTLVLALAIVVVYADLYGEETEDAPAIEFLVPYLSIVAFALLGAYFYGLNIAVRGYFRGDLQPKTYSQISGRILKVIVLCALIWAIFAVTADGSPLGDPAPGTDGSDFGAWRLSLIFAFFVGIVPNTFLTWVYEDLRKRFRLDRAKLVEAQPLTDVQGVDLYDRARLEQEGVTNLEALVHGELVDLMIQTRIPTGRLVDWLDQAVLLLYTDDVRAAVGGTGSAAKPPAKGKKAAMPDLADALHARGIRTASQLLCECRRDDYDDGRPVSSLRIQLPSHREVREFSRQLTKGSDGLSEVALENAILGMLTEPCMRRVLAWKANPAPQERRIDAVAGPGRTGHGSGERRPGAGPHSDPVAPPVSIPGTAASPATSSPAERLPQDR